MGTKQSSIEDGEKTEGFPRVDKWRNYYILEMNVEANAFTKHSKVYKESSINGSHFCFGEKQIYKNILKLSMDDSLLVYDHYCWR